MKIAFDIPEQLLGNDTFPRNPAGVGPLVSSLAKNAIMVAGLITVIMIIVGGITLIASAGEGNSQNAAKAKQAVTAGVVGFVLVFASYWIVQIIEIITGVDIL